MRDSQNCIFCTNGRHVSYAIFNTPCTKEEYEAKKEEILSSYESIEKAKKEFAKLKEKSIIKYASQTKCHNVTGNYLHNCFDGVELFDTYDAKNCSYMTDTESPIDSMDCNNYYYKPSFGYNIMGALEGSRLKNSAFVFYCNEVEYCESCHHLSDALGCIGIRKGSYMILNKEYAKEEYTVLRKQIGEQMKGDSNYGQFFAPDIAPFSYNEALAQDIFPLTRDQAIEYGFRWQEQTTGTFGKETIRESDLPVSIDKTPETILSDILACRECGKNYRITQAEFEFYKRMGIPLPHLDFECRHQARMAKRNPRKLWHRACVCEAGGHDHTGTCPNEFETSYAPDRPEKVYCESCYQKEVL